MIHRLEDGRYALTPGGRTFTRRSMPSVGGPDRSWPDPEGEDHFRPNWIRHMVVARFEGIDPLRKDSNGRTALR